MGSWYEPTTNSSQEKIGGWMTLGGNRDEVWTNHNAMRYRRMRSNKVMKSLVFLGKKLVKPATISGGGGHRKEPKVHKVQKRKVFYGFGPIAPTPASLPGAFSKKTCCSGGNFDASQQAMVSGSSDPSKDVLSVPLLEHPHQNSASHLLLIFHHTP